MANSSSPTTQTTLNPTLNNVVEIHQNDPPKSAFLGGNGHHTMEGFWFGPSLLKPAITFKSDFQARDDDVFLA
ncbi:hypothetical protein C2S52_016046 [Perilla frutescens var. hirtella]|nr:hypothetical protein C2S52_016046 [Perilla frutescens var. hirtella]